MYEIFGEKIPCRVIRNIMNVLPETTTKKYGEPDFEEEKKMISSIQIETGDIIDVVLGGGVPILTKPLFTVDRETPESAFPRLLPESTIFYQVPIRINLNLGFIFNFRSSDAPSKKKNVQNDKYS